MAHSRVGRRVRVAEAARSLLADPNEQRSCDGLAEDLVAGLVGISERIVSVERGKDSLAKSHGGEKAPSSGRRTWECGVSTGYSRMHRGDRGCWLLNVGTCRHTRPWRLPSGRPDARRLSVRSDYCEARAAG
jgi:hypothetical protein